MVSFVISSGHGKLVRGAKGYLDEVDEARRVVEKVADYLRGMGVPVLTFHDDTSTSQNQNLNTIVNYHNRQVRDYDVSVHFNAYQTTSKAMGCEVLYVTQQSLSAKVSAGIAAAGAFINRGAKKRTDLFFLNNTAKPALLLEVCFVDSSTDADLYRQRFDAICRAIAETISGQTIEETPPPIEPPVEPPVEPPFPEAPTGNNRVDMVGTVQGDVAVIINGVLVQGSLVRCANTVTLDIAPQGDVVVTINGQDFQNAPVEAT